MKIHSLWIGGRTLTSALKHEIHSPFDGKKVAEVFYAQADHVENAVAQAKECFHAFRNTSRFARSLLLKKMADGLEAARTELVSCIVEEAGKPFSFAQIEVTRAIQTFTLASEEAKRLSGEIIPIDLEASSQAFTQPAHAYFVPRGPVLAIAPFNFPLNLVAHKVARALAVGTPVIVKPSPQAPGAAHILAKIFEASVRQSDPQIPLSALQVVSCDVSQAEKMVADPRLPLVSFTGSASVGWRIQSQAIGKKVILELGGNAAVIVHEDADLDRAALRCAVGGFAYAGQVCISVQRIYAHEKIFDRFKAKLVSEIQKLGVGNPQDANVTVGPLIDEKNKKRVLEWIDEAIDNGAKYIFGEKSPSSQQVVSPIVLTQVRKDLKVICEEVFGPVVILERFRDEDEALTEVNRSRYGLQAGLFTNSFSFIQKAIKNLDVGGVIVNEVPMFRADNMPYGGMKESGLGREGVKYAMQEYCDLKTVVFYG